MRWAPYAPSVVLIGGIITSAYGVGLSVLLLLTGMLGSFELGRRYAELRKESDE